MHKVNKAGGCFAHEGVIIKNTWLKKLARAS